MNHTPAPIAIRNHPYGWLLVSKWWDCHNRDQQFSVVFTGEPGKGKSSSAISLAMLMDRTRANVMRFTLDRIAFTSDEFFDLVNKSYPAGSAIVLDDAGLFAYSADAMTREGKEISKIFQSVRHKNLMIFITLPALSMLTKNVRLIAQNTAEVMGINWEKQQTIIKFLSAYPNPQTGEIIYKAPIKPVTSVDPYTGVKVVHKVKSPYIRLDKPPESAFKEYKRIKANRMKAFYAESKSRTKKILSAKKIPFEVAYEKTKKNLDEFLTRNGKVDPFKIMTQAHSLFGFSVSISRAERIARGINSELKEQREY